MTVREPYSVSVVIYCILKFCLNVRLVFVRDLPRHCPLELEERDLANETSPILLEFQKSSPILCLSVRVWAMLSSCVPPISGTRSGIRVWNVSS